LELCEVNSNFPRFVDEKISNPLENHVRKLKRERRKRAADVPTEEDFQSNRKFDDNCGSAISSDGCSELGAWLKRVPDADMSWVR
jgi:hypothetical protein